MKKIINSLIVFALCLGLMGCATANNSRESMEKDKMENAVEKFQEMMDKDKTGDKKSVYWDGETASMVADEYDNDEISDGRYMRGCVYLEKELWSINIAGMEDREEIINEETHVLFKGENWRFEVTLTNKQEEFDATVEKLKNDNNLKLIIEEVGSNVFRGIKEVDGKYYAGYDMTINDYCGHYYEVSYFGLGNMGDIEAMASQLKNQLTGNFTIENKNEKDAKVFGN